MDYTQDAMKRIDPPLQAQGVSFDGKEVDKLPLTVQIARSVRLFWDRRRIVLAILSIGIILSIMYAISLPAIYTSKTTLMPPDNSSTSSNLMGWLATSGPAANIGGALLGAKTPGAVFVGILGSRTVQQGIVTRLDLVRQYRTHSIEDACVQLAASTHILEDPKSGIIAISVNASTPMLASSVAQAYVDELNSVVANNGTSAARRERVFLEERLKEIKQDLDDSSKALSQFSTKSRTIDLPSQAKATVDSGLKMQAELGSARSELAGLEQAYSGDNVRVRSARARIEELQSQLNKINGTPKEGGSSADANKLDYPTVEELPTLALTYSNLEREVSVDEALWEVMTKQYEAAKVQEAKDMPSVRVLDAADVPQRKSSPVRSYIVIIGAAASLFVAYIYLLAISVWEDMSEQDELKQLLREIASAGISFKGMFENRVQLQKHK